MLINILDNIQQWDIAAFKKINVDWVVDWLTPIFVYFRKPVSLIPLYVALLVYLFYKKKPKQVIPWLVFVVAIIIFSDQLSSHLLKSLFGRVRPCNLPALASVINFKVGYRPQSGSFPSSHAVNNFAIEGFFFFTLRKLLGAWSWFFLFIAAFISYGQVYVGVHFVTDIVGGTILGLLIAYGFGQLYQKMNNKYLNASTRI